MNMSSNQHDDLVSIIIPCYNAEKFIEKTIRYTFNQTYSNFELICVDDGSTDNTVKIIEKLTQEYNLRLFTQPNSGALEARRTGVKHSNGKYVTFIDADDRIDIDAIEISMKKINKLHVDAILWEFYSDDEQIESALITYKQERIVSGYDALEMTIGRWSLTGMGLLKKDIYQQSYDLFDEFNLTSFNSDEFLTRIYFSLSKNVFLSKVKYFYFNNAESTTRKFDMKWIYAIDTNKKIKELLTKINLLDKFKNNIIDQYLNTITHLYSCLNLNKQNLTDSDVKLLLMKCKEGVNEFTLSEYFRWLFTSRKSIRKKINFIKIINKNRKNNIYINYNTTSEKND